MSKTKKKRKTGKRVEQPALVMCVVETATDLPWRERWSSEQPELKGPALCIVSGHKIVQYGLDDRCETCKLRLPHEGKRLGNCDCGHRAEYSVMLRYQERVYSDHVCRNCVRHLSNTPKLTFEVMTNVKT
jgi:hypothetical protein